MGNISDALQIGIDLLLVAINLQAQAQKVTALIQQAQLEGRDLTDAELDSLRQARLDARAQAVNA